MKKIKNCHLYQGDCIEILSKIPDKSVNLVFADPPYNIGKRFSNFVDRWESEEQYYLWCFDWLDLCIAKLVDNGSLYLMSSTQAMPVLDLFLRDKLTVLSRIVWSYDSSGVQAKKYYGSLYEPILFCVKNKSDYAFNWQDILIKAKTGADRKLIDYRKSVPTVYGDKKVPGNVWSDISRVRFKMSEYCEHPTQKPEALLERIILASSNKGDTVLDPFCGSGTTCVVAQRLGRKSIGIELQKEYYRLCVNRLNAN